MPLPIRHLPVVQNWDCHTCGNCCTDYVVSLSAEERQRIHDQGWHEHPDFKGKKVMQRQGKWWQFWRRSYQLAHGAGDRCIFLSEKGLCRIHEKFGLDAKPFACRLYPYILVPAGDHWRISMRYACPSATANLGRPLQDQTAFLKQMTAEMETWDRHRFDMKADQPLGPPPPLHGGQRVSWAEIQIFVDVLLAMLRDADDSLPRRMLKCLALARMCKQSKFDALKGNRLREFLTLLAPVVGAEVPRDLARIPPPTWIGRVLFRSTLAVYLRKDSGMRRGAATRNRFALMWAMWRMVRGKGVLPKLQVGLPAKTFAEMNEPGPPLTPEANEALQRYYATKVESLQFFGRTNHGYSFWNGFEALAITLPAILWLARGYSELDRTQAVYKAITVVDENFGYNPLLGQFRQRFGMRILSFRQELDRLIAWYRQ